MATVMEEEKVEEQRGRERLTDKRLEKLVAPRGGRLEIADALVRELRVSASCSNCVPPHVEHCIETDLSKSLPAIGLPPVVSA
ncbi:hypothetical protein [Qipengyuania sp. ASV99]|uniref:hypothetical protein n=1 Tax=Qipengyuania sp. ASV99 TaxID=3399681 RepID=UPI003A4C6C4B